nr:MAG TPA: hypothetical protein [Caudoviricetes sp.]
MVNPILVLSARNVCLIPLASIYALIFKPSIFSPPYTVISCMLKYYYGIFVLSS